MYYPSNYLKIIVLFFLFIQVTHSQDNLIQHVIKKGENVYRLALRYNVSMDEIFNLNPGSKELIKTGDILYIPKESSNSNSQKKSKSNYLVSKGETKYGISKTFGISISELENANPFIKSGLQAGHNLKIPSNIEQSQSDNYSSKQHIVKKGETLWGISQKYGMSLNSLLSLNRNNTDDILQIGEVLLITNPSENQTNPNSYVVKKGDTKYGLSKQFGISISELERLNPQIIDVLKTGDLIRFQKSIVNASVSTDSDISDKKEKQTAPSSDWYVIKPKETIYSIAKKTGISNEELIALNPKLATAVLAGDTLIINRSILNKVSNKEESLNFNAELIWTDPSSEKDLNKVDYFNGLKHAIKRAKSKYPKMTLEYKDINLSDTLMSDGTQDSSIRFKIKPNPSFIDPDIDNLSSFTVYENKDTSEKTILINALPNKDVMLRKTINYLNSKNENIICLYDNDHSENSKLLKKEIPKAKLLKINKKNIFKSKELEKSLDKENKNYVIIESSKVGVFLSATSLLLKKSSTYDIQLVVLNSNNIPDSSKISYNRFKILNLTYPMPYNPNYLKESSDAYRASYVISSEILNRLNTNGIDAFKDNSSTSFLGTTFKYNFNNNIAENKAVSIYMFNDDSNSFLLDTY